MRTKPGFTLAAVFTMALGISATATVFSVVNGVLLRPLSYHEPERLVRLWETNPGHGAAFEMTSLPTLSDWRARSSAFEEISAWERAAPVTLTGNEPAEELTANFVTANFFHLLGAPAGQGRTFLDAEQTPGQDRVVVLSHGLWQRLFGARADAIGTLMELEERAHRVVGVMPSSFKSPTGETDVWLPMTLDAPATDRGQHYLQAIARLKPGASLERAQGEMDRVAAWLAEQYPDSNKGWGVRLVSLEEHVVGGARSALLIVLGSVSFVLLIACANVAILLLVRAAARGREMAIRAAIGATRARVARQVLTENALLALLGGSAGLLIAKWMLPLVKGLSPGNIPRLDEVHLDAATVTVVAGVSVLSGLFFGAAPALSACRTSLNDALKEGGGRGATAGAGRRRAGQVFVVMQIALAFVLLVATGLLVKSFRGLQAVSPGFDAGSLLVVRLSLGRTYHENRQRITYFQRLTERLRALPSVESVGGATVLPLNEFGIDFNVPYHRQGELEPLGSAAPKAAFRSATADYFRAMQTQLVKGRVFDDRDSADAPYVVVVNRTLARHAWPDQDPVGMQLHFKWADWRAYEVVGMVEDSKSYGLAEPARPELFVPYEQNPYAVMNVVVRTVSDDPESLTESVRRAFLEVDPHQPAHGVVTMEALLAKSLAREKFSTSLVGLLSAIALMLATVGVYGVVSNWVSLRTHEIGVRIALGARPLDVLKLVLGRAMALALLGLGAGVLAAIALTRLLASLLFGVTATDPTAFAFTALLLACAVLGACYVPARRAARIDPIEALRCE